MLGKEKIRDLFGYHEPVISKDPDDEEANAVVTKHIETRRKFREFAEYLDETLTDDDKFPAMRKDVIFKKLVSVSEDVHRAIAVTRPIRLSEIEIIPLKVDLVDEEG